MQLRHGVMVCQRTIGERLRYARTVTVSDSFSLDWHLQSPAEAVSACVGP